MATEPPQKYTGALSVDLSALVGVLVDLRPKETQRLRQEKEGMDGVIDELAGNTGKHSAAGITSELYTRFLKCNEQLAQIRANRTLVDKLSEVLEESEIYTEHVREGIVSMMCKAVKGAAQHDDPTMSAPFEMMLHYNAQIAEKAAKTRLRNQEGGGGAPEPAPGQGDPPK